MNYLILIQTLISSVQAVESLMPASAGADKFKAVVTMAEAVVGSVQVELPAIQGIVKVLVDGFNLSGLFKRKAV